MMTLRSDSVPALTWPSVTEFGLTLKGASTSTVTGMRSLAIDPLFVLSQMSVYHLPAGVSLRSLAVIS